MQPIPPTSARGWDSMYSERYNLICAYFIFSLSLSLGIYTNHAAFLYIYSIAHNKPQILIPLKLINSTALNVIWPTHFQIKYITWKTNLQRTTKALFMY